MDNWETQNSLDPIAIIGIAGRFPGAKNVNEFWQNLCNGVECVSFFTDKELIAVGINRDILNDPNYIKAKAVLDDIELFDASFFGFTPKEAEVMDPQHRLFLENAWEALENAGYNPEAYDGRIGVYAGASLSTYLISNLTSNPSLLQSLGRFQICIGNDKDFLPTRTSYKLNLQGPSINVSTACSTSLVAIQMACQSLLNYQCDMALAGGVSVSVPQKEGYWYQKGGIGSPDGHCRAFDAQAQGTVAGSGVGIVILKRLEDALADRDHIYAIIKGSAVNNDGSLKVGYTAPSIDGQATVISEALDLAGVEAETISYVETHGTGTELGDPIEIAALTQAFHAKTLKKKGYCAIGSLKTNIGHLDAAAGVAGLIKTALALKYKLLPPTLHFKQPNPKIDFANSPFYINTTLCEWKTDIAYRRAGVSSFGIGGTNAHVILEEAPTQNYYGKSRTWQLLVISAKSTSALDTATTNLAEHLKQHPELKLADIAYTLNIGRKAFNYRRMLVCQDIEDAVNALHSLPSQRVFTEFQNSRERTLSFLFSGQGTQYVNMALELYQFEPIFREWVDLCSDILKSYLGLDLRQVLYPCKEWANEAALQLEQTTFAQPALFTIEYALAKLWMEWGVHPQAMIGHSIGEYVAACLAGVLSLEDALFLVSTRGQLMQQLPSGAMLTVPLTEQEVQPFLSKKLSLAAINGASLCTVSGNKEAVEELQNQLTAQGKECRLLHTSHAFHSEMMEPILEQFSKFVITVSLKPPKISYLSNVTGTWITAAEATDPNYWTRHLRQTVRFDEGIQQLLKEPEQILLEIGPGRTLSTLVKRNSNKVAEQIVLSSLRHPQESQSDLAFLLAALGKLWLAGGQVNWSKFYEHERRHRLPLPTYPFERQQYWIELPSISQPIQSQQDRVDSTPLHSRPKLQNTYKEPRNELEQNIADIWKDFFGIAQVGIDDDFFELGGDSLLAVQIVSKLCQTLQIKLPSHSLLNTPTVAALAQLIEEITSAVAYTNQSSQQALPSPLVAIQASSSLKPPLFLVHPVGGHLYFYRDLIRYLGSDQPIYGFQAPGLEGETKPFTTVEEMATYYVKALQAFQPQGSYFLGGSSFGGAVAFEMAQQLQALGQKVALVALIDTPGIGQMLMNLKDKASILSDSAGSLRNKDSIPQHIDVNKQMIDALEQAKNTHLLPPDIELSQASNFLQVYEANTKAISNYIPHIYPGKLIFFRAKEREKEYELLHPELTWIDVAAGGVEIHTVPGNHITMNFAPHVQVLAEQLRRILLEMIMLQG